MINIRSRSGMTLLEVLLAMTIFLIGSVSLMGLFVTASALHADAMNRRRASFIAEELLAEVRALHFREVFAKTNVDGPSGGDAGGTVTVFATGPTEFRQGALFSTFPAHYLLNPITDPNAAVQIADRTSGPILLEGGGAVEREWAWASYSTVGTTFNIAAGDRPLWGTNTGPPFHADGARVLQPRSWRFVLDQDLAVNDTTVAVRNDTTAPQPPASGYIVVDEEWMPYASFASGDPGSFTVADVSRRGWGGTRAAAHLAGTPVTVAREHPFYPGFYYTVQFYPTDAMASSAQVIVTVGYGNQNYFRVHTFHSIYSPTGY